MNFEFQCSKAKALNSNALKLKLWILGNLESKALALAINGKQI